MGFQGLAWLRVLRGARGLSGAQSSLGSSSGVDEAACNVPSKARCKPLVWVLDLKPRGQAPFGLRKATLSAVAVRGTGQEALAGLGGWGLLPENQKLHLPHSVPPGGCKIHDPLYGMCGPPG